MLACLNNRNIFKKQRRKHYFERQGFEGCLNAVFFGKRLKKHHVAVDEKTTDNAQFFQEIILQQN